MAYEKSNCLLLILGLIAALGAGLVFPLFNFIFSGILEMMMDPLQNDGELNTYCLYMAIIAFSAGALTFFYSLCFGVASDRLVYTIRLTMFKKLMKLPVSYYDRPENTAGGINSKLAFRNFGCDEFEYRHCFRFARLRSVLFLEGDSHFLSFESPNCCGGLNKHESYNAFHYKITVD